MQLHMASELWLMWLQFRFLMSQIQQRLASICRSGFAKPQNIAEMSAEVNRSCMNWLKKGSAQELQH